MLDSPLTVGLVHVTLRVPFIGRGLTEMFTGNGATVYC